ncbi:FecR family protein [Draconibacterium sediminis]|uniref:FecR protein domain-containing protein n=1 Tax=Draconibacterium sediminis TaxID=1544798 RepID=A0A0D8JIP0_9BACT|nr:FecR family protein [Draconibacterium sediminis]KJF45708.1 hypothetical protein LH29_10355 [Draconibacterium sediminis]
MSKEQYIEELLPGWFEDSLSREEKQKVSEWIDASDENARSFNEFEKVWQQTERLRSMQKYDAVQALQKVHKRIHNTTKTSFVEIFKRIAAVLILPLLFASIYFYLQEPDIAPEAQQWYTLKTETGMRSQFELPDGTYVFLNSNTSLRYPLAFSGNTREVELQGEAYFDVAKNDEKPFLVNTGKIVVEVTGTEFKASNYTDEQLVEVVLVEGSVNLCQCAASGQRSVIQALKPGDKATLAGSDNKLFVEQVDVAKYIAWKNGVLMFRDDSMEDVVRRLNRWYNVDIDISSVYLEDYVYTATFEDETLIQVLDLLKLSAPIDYRIKNRKRKADNTFSKMEIEIIEK